MQRLTRMSPNFLSILAIILFGLLSNHGYSQKIFSIDGKKGYINPKGDTIYKAILEDVFIDVDSPIRYYVHFNTTWGIMNAEGRFIIEPTYSDLHRENYFYFAVLNGKHGLLDFNGKVLIPFQYQGLKNLQSSYDDVNHWLVKLDDLCGIVNIKGEILAPIQYHSIYSGYSGMRFVACKKDDEGFHYGVLDSAGKEAVPFIYSYIDPFQNFAYDLINVELKYKPVYISYRTNKIKLPPIYKKLTRFEKDTLFSPIIWVQDSFVNWGGVDSNNQVKVNFDYKEQGSAFFRGMAVVKRTNHEGLIDTSGTILLAIKYKYLEGSFCNGFMYFESEKKHGYIQPDFNEVIWNKKPLKRYLATHFVKTTPSQLKNVNNSSSSFKPKKLPKKSLNAMLVRHSAMKNACSLEEHLAYYGMPDAFLGNCIYADQLKALKKELIFPILASESLRIAAWSWVAPSFKKCFQLLPLAHQLLYKRILRALKAYMARFDIAAVERYLKEHPSDFGNYTWEKNYDREQYIDRKITSALDRLIVYHHLLSEEDARRWVNTIANEVETW